MSDVAYLLDTNAAVALLNGDAAINIVLSQAEMFIPSISVGELYYGAEKSVRVRENVQRVEVFVNQRDILVCDIETARWYGRIFQALRSKGRPIPQNDVWIAAIALQHHLTLLTRDAHFNEVDNLPVQGW